MSEQSQVTTKEKVDVRTLTDAEKLVILPPKVGSFLPGGAAVKVFPAAKEVPIDDEDKAKTTLSNQLKITRSADDVNVGYAYLKRLQVLQQMLEGAENSAALRTKAKTRREQVAQVFQDNMEKVYAQQKNLEKTYRELDAFFYEAQVFPGEKVANIGIVNASPKKHFAQLTDTETGLASFVASRENFDMKNLKGLMVMPEWPGSEAKLLQYGKMAQHFSAHLFSGFPEMELKEAHEAFAVGGEFAELKSADPVKQHISLVANGLRMRKANRFESKGDFYINPASLLAGKVYKGDITEGLHVAQANKPHEVKIPTADGSPLEMKWNVRGALEMKFNKSVIPLAYFEGIVFWGVDNLYLASGTGDQGMDQYTVKRCDEYINKTVLHFLNSQIFFPNERTNRERIQTAIQKFLMHNTGGPEKMLEFGKVEGVDTVQNPDGSVANDQLNVRVSVKYKNAVRNIFLHLVSEEGMGWKEGA
ncbi:MAG TPA: hypothetical protein PLW09_04450 [Candidatus Kapabacteria bacterium]|nr:hypothetical protein [Candidatus Kapabacteria bacterium]